MSVNGSKWVYMKAHKAILRYKNVYEPKWWFMIVYECKW